MFDKLRSYFADKVEISDEEFDIMRKVFICKELRKGEFLQREGELTKYGAFVATGFLRSYIIDSKGKEHIVQFAPENWWISDLNGLMNQSPSVYFIDAIENSEVLLIDLPSHKRLMEEVPGFSNSFQAGMQKRNSVKDKRIIESLSASAEDRYQQFLSTYPSIAQRVPQHMLASYLGVSPETLSRIRRQAAGKK